MNGRKRYREYAHKLRLFKEQNGRCCYCKRQMVLTKQGYHGPHFPMMATIEHLVDRFHPDRQLPIPGEKRHMIACYDCNHKRAERRESENKDLHLAMSIAGHEKTKHLKRWWFREMHRKADALRD